MIYMEERKDTRKRTEGEVDLVELLSGLWNERKFIMICCAVGAVLGLVVGFSIPKTYKARMSFAPETEQQMSSGVSSIASMMGISLNNSVDAISVDMFPDVVASTPFIFGLFDLPVETADSLSTTLLDYLKNHQKRPWWSYVAGAPFKVLDLIFDKDELQQDRELVISNLPKSERNVISYLSKSIAVEIDKKTGKATISVTTQDPFVSAAVLDAVVVDLKQYMSDYRTSKDRQDVENLKKICEERKKDYHSTQQAYADFADANKNLVKLNAQAEQLRLQHEMQLAYQVYSQVATQLEGARIKEQQSKPVFVVLEPVAVPIRKDAPSKSRIMVAFVFMAAIFAVIWVAWGRNRYEEMKKKQL